MISPSNVKLREDLGAFELVDDVSDAELRLDATRDDGLNDLEDGGVERWQAHTKTARDWPNRPRVSKSI